MGVLRDKSAYRVTLDRNVAKILPLAESRRNIVQAAKIAIVIPADRHVDLRVPADLPEGPAEVIVLITPKQKAAPPDRRAALGMDRGKVQIADDFDAPLPEDLQRAFEGEA